MTARVSFLLCLFFALAPPPVLAGEVSRYFCVFKNLLAPTTPVPLEISLALLKQRTPATTLTLRLKAMPETWLGDDRSEGVHYFSEQERDGARIYASQGLLYNAHGELLELPFGSMFVMDGQGFMYAISFDRPDGRIHHSSFLAGGAVAAAGGITVKGGKIVKVDNGSGHYAPRKLHLLQVKARMEELGVPLPLEKMFVHGSPHSLAESIHLEEFSSSRAFSQKIHGYDPDDWPEIVLHCLKSDDETVRQAAMGLLGGNNGHLIDPTAVRKIVEMGLADPSRLVQEDAAAALAVWNRRESPLDLYDLVVRVSTGPYSPRAKDDALGGLSRYHGGNRPFEFVEQLLQGPSNLNPSAYASLYRYLNSVSADAALGAKATAMMTVINGKLVEWERGSDKQRSDDARWALQYLR